MMYFLSGNERSGNEWVQLYKRPFATLYEALKYALEVFHLKGWKEDRGKFTIKTFDRIYTITKERPA